jgi:hypothetical protein
MGQDRVCIIEVTTPLSGSGRMGSMNLPLISTVVLCFVSRIKRSRTMPVGGCSRQQISGLGTGVGIGSNASWVIELHNNTVADNQVPNGWSLTLLYLIPGSPGHYTGVFSLCTPTNAACGGTNLYQFAYSDDSFEAVNPWAVTVDCSDPPCTPQGPHPCCA